MTVSREPRTDHPRTNRDRGEIERKLALLDNLHVKPLNDYVRRLRACRGEDTSIPWFDPTEGGIEAPILLLLEAPGRRATAELGSGFISADNNDGSAENMWNILREAGVDRSREIVVWNVVPWYIGTPKGIRAAKREDIAEAHEALIELLALLPRLRVVVLVGDRAAEAWEVVGLDLPTVQAPHPSPKNLNSRPHYRAKIVAALIEARERAGLAPRREVRPDLLGSQGMDMRTSVKRRAAAATRRASTSRARIDGVDRDRIGDLLMAGLTPEQVKQRLGPSRGVWLAAIEEEARREGELDAFPATPGSIVQLRDEGTLRWEAIAARVYGDARKVRRVKQLYDEAKGVGAAKRSYAGRGRRFAEME